MPCGIMTLNAAPVSLSAIAKHAKGPSDRSKNQPLNEDIHQAVESVPISISSGLMTTAMVRF